MSLIIVPQISSKYNIQLWKPEVVTRPNFVKSLYNLVERNTMYIEECDFGQFKCIRFLSNSGTLPNIVFYRSLGPIVYYKKDGFNDSEADYMLRMLNKVKGKQPVRY